ncbi:hypothetical protein CP981_17525 [Streptomyces platensis]|uniref:Uncharacterized protein n=1 Tax=Streptomyces platensis TaxID=58346 RepID=A0AAE6NHN1_STRPT|nr:hypothetical protein [Streptomyces platensis]QEV53229.1 hypothetical protein CP981_17525 [Streptomyces platensis]
MIRVITRTRLAALQEDVARYRERTREVQAAADASYAGHLRTAWILTTDAEAAERAAEANRADAQIAREILERTEAQLADARATVTEQAARIDALSGDLDAMAEAVVLLHYGQLHSLHRDEAAAKRHAASFGIDPDAWGTVPSDRPVVESVWRISPLSKWAVADGGDAG